MKKVQKQTKKPSRLPLLAIMLGGILLLGSLGHKTYKKSDMYLRTQIVQLQSPIGACTGVQVQAPSGSIYVLTAAHCRPLVDGGALASFSESGDMEVLKFIAEDPDSDLMLLSTNKKSGVRVALDVFDHENIKSLTHGAKFPTYKTEGEILELRRIKAMLSIIPPMPESQCQGNKFKIENVDIMGLMTVKVCFMDTYQMVTSAWVVPGSSGGPMFSLDGELVGIVSTGGGVFSTIVNLSDIQAFLSKY